MPVKRLWPWDRGEIESHLLALGPRDRQRRFCAEVGDTFIRDYVRRIDWPRTVVLGHAADGRLGGIVELIRIGERWPLSAELALSVASGMQDRGIGTALMARALAVARNRFYATVHMLCLAENRRMQRLALKFGGVLDISDGDAAARIRTPWPTSLTLLDEATMQGPGLLVAARARPAEGAGRPSRAG